jgi:hypothetical protein
MSMRLRLASLWLPRRIVIWELDKIEAATNAALDELIALNGSAAREVPEASIGWGLEERRAALAQGHERRVRALVDRIGREEAIRAARKALFRTGLEMGREARSRLGVGDSLQDLIRAAGVLYRILGIEFTVIDAPEGRRLEVHRCPLASWYSHEACLMLSAVDEGVVSGLSPEAAMRFTEYISGGAPHCVALISYKEGT